MAFLQCGFSSEILGMKTNMNVLLPQDTLRQSKQAPPVLYLLHGHTDDHAAWSRFTGLERFVRELNLAVVMPTVHNGFYTNTEIGYRYFDFCTQELPALVSTMFHVSTAREDTFVAGLSMGGYGAWRLALGCPERYCYAASMSGVLDIAGECEQRLGDPDVSGDFVRDIVNAFGPEGARRGSECDLLYLADRVSASGGPKPILRQYCGTEDFLYESNQRAKQHVGRLGFDYAYAEGPGAHTWDYWDARIQDILSELAKINPKICCK